MTKETSVRYAARRENGTKARRGGSGHPKNDDEETRTGEEDFES